MDEVAFHPRLGDRNKLCLITECSVCPFAESPLPREEKLRQVQMLEVPGMIDAGDIGGAGQGEREVHDLDGRAFDSPVASWHADTV